MTDRELMQMALDALESDCGATKFGASEALRARLAQPEPEPVAWMHDSHVGFNVPLYTAPPQREWQNTADKCELEPVPAKGTLLPAQPEPEPVAWISAEETWLVPKLVISDTPKDGYKPVYTAPPQREWQGLMDEDWIIGKRSADYIAGAEWAEAKLKEKNT